MLQALLAAKATAAAQGQLASAAVDAAAILACVLSHNEDQVARMPHHELQHTSPAAGCRVKLVYQPICAKCQPLRNVAKSRWGVIFWSLSKTHRRLVW